MYKRHDDIRRLTALNTSSQNAISQENGRKLSKFKYRNGMSNKITAIATTTEQNKSSSNWNRQNTKSKKRIIITMRGNKLKCTFFFFNLRGFRSTPRCFCTMKYMTVDRAIDAFDLTHYLSPSWFNDCLCFSFGYRKMTITNSINNASRMKENRKRN